MKYKLKKLSLLVMVIGISCCRPSKLAAAPEGLIEVMAQQIAKLQLLYENIKQDYEICQSGLNFIGDLKNGDLNLHTDYFNSLEVVKSGIKKDQKVGAILAMQLKILTDCTNFLSAFKKSGAFSKSELNYLSTVYSTLLSDLATDLVDLSHVITDGDLQMKDDERMNRIDKVYSAVSDKYDFFYTFSNQATYQSLQRQGTLSETQKIQKLYIP